MKKIYCEMCGSSDLIKNEGLFVCQNCGCRYSPEDAKKLYVDGIVSIEGKVKIDSGEIVERLMKSAKMAYNSGYYEESLNFYNRVLEQDPNNDEALFYKGLCVLRCTNLFDINNTSFKKYFDLSIRSFYEKEPNKEDAKKRLIVMGNQILRIIEEIYASGEKFYSKNATSRSNILKLHGILYSCAETSHYVKKLIERDKMCYEFGSPLPAIYARACNNTIIYCDSICRERTYKEYVNIPKTPGGPRFIIKYERPKPATLRYYGNLRQDCLRSLKAQNLKKQNKTKSFNSSQKNSDSSHPSFQQESSHSSDIPESNGLQKEPESALNWTKLGKRSINLIKESVNSQKKN